LNPKTSRWNDLCLSEDKKGGVDAQKKQKREDRKVCGGGVREEASGYHRPRSAIEEKKKR